MNLFVTWIVTSISFLITSYLVPGFKIADFKTALLMSIAWGIVQVVIKPILVLFTLPITILTLGLFYVIINAILLMIAGSFVPGVYIDGFLSALFAGLVLSTVNMILQKLAKE